MHDRLAGRRLAATGLAHETECLATADVERDVRDRRDLSSAVDREVDDQVLHAQYHVLAAAQVSRAATGHQAPPVGLGAERMRRRAWICTLFSSVSGEPTG